MRVNIEEKTYESYFNNELNQLSEIYFPLGQVQEGKLGFDSSAMSNNPILWRTIGYPNLSSYSGTNLREIAETLEIVFGEL